MTDKTTPGEERAQKAVADMLYAIGAYAQNIDPRDKHAAARLETLASVTGLFCEVGYKEDAEETVDDISQKADECNFKNPKWLHRLKKKAGLLGDDLEESSDSRSDDDEE